MFEHMYLRHPRPDIGGSFNLSMASFTAAKNGRSGPSWNKKNTSTRRSKTEALCLYQQSSFSLYAFFFRAGEHGSINCQIFTLIHLQVSLLVEPAALLPTSGSAASLRYTTNFFIHHAQLPYSARLIHPLLPGLPKPLNDFHEFCNNHRRRP